MSNKLIGLTERGPCPLCGTPDWAPFIGFADIPVVRCVACGFLYSHRLMNSDTLAEYYRQGFGSERHRQGQIINARINAWAIQRLVPLAGIHHFLDVGAGYGYLIKQMAERYGVHSIGVELSEQEARYGQTQLGVDIRNGALAEARLVLGSFDLVACFEVIEHIPEPQAFLDELLSYVKPGGRVLVMTDNFESLVASALGHGFPKWIPHSHISHFVPTTLEKLFKDKGLQIGGRLSYTPWELWARLYYSRLRGIRPSLEEAFNLTEVLASEMHGQYRWFNLRRWVNLLWAQATASSNLQGALMYLVGQRVE